MLQSISSVFVVYRHKTLTGSPDPTHGNGTDKPCSYHQQPAAEKRNDGYTVCPAQLDATQAEVAPEVDAPTLDDTMDALESWYNDGFLISLRQAATISESQSGHCFNCQKEGHYWCQCKETLSSALQELSDQQDREREEQKKRSLNPQGAWE